MDDPELDSICRHWSVDLARTVEERSAWPHLGGVEVLDHNAEGWTLGGFIDRHELPVAPGATPGATLSEFRASPGGRIANRVLTYVNAELFQRLPPPRARMDWSDPWWSELDPQRPIVLLGTASDLVSVVRRARGSAFGARLRHATVDAATRGTCVAVTASEVRCRVLLMMAANFEPAAGRVWLLTSAELKALLRGVRRVDVTVGG